MSEQIRDQDTGAGAGVNVVTNAGATTDPGTGRGAHTFAAAPRPGAGTAALRLVADRTWRLLVVAVGVLAVLNVLARVQVATVAVFIALVITAVLRPVVDRLDRVLPRPLAVASAFLLAAVVVLGVLTFIGTSVAAQWGQLYRSLVVGIDRLQAWILASGLPVTQRDLNGWLEQAQTWLTSHQGTLAGAAFAQVTSITEVLSSGILAVFLAVFFIAGGSGMWRWFLAQCSDLVRGRVDRGGRAAWHAFSGYTLGTFLVAAANALMVVTALLLLRVPLAVPLALLVFMGSFVPLIGSPIAMVLATVVALAGRGPVTALVVLVLIVVFGQIEGHLLQPLVMSGRVSLHPVVVALAITCGTILGGLVGAVVAVPVVAVVWAVRQSLRRPGTPSPEPAHAGAAVESPAAPSVSPMSSSPRTAAVDARPARD